MIPNPIDTSAYAPQDRYQARQNLGLPQDKHLLLSGSAKVTNPFKGFAYLVAALNQLDQAGQADQLALVLLGQAGDQEFGLSANIPVYYLGYQTGTAAMSQCYNACDLLMLPSLQDNLPNTVMEAMACGTPTVGFEVGGVPQMVDHKVNGYLAELKNASDLAEGIDWALASATRWRALSHAARHKVEQEFAYPIVAGQMQELYEELRALRKA
jgi:glycosyltransferase involved in cell wall biosynthesis